MQYLNSENKTLIITSVPVSNVDVKVDFNGNLVATLIIEVKDFEKLENEYRGLIQDTFEKMHNYLECENQHCSNIQCYEYRDHQRNKYILER